MTESSDPVRRAEDGAAGTALLVARDVECPDCDQRHDYECCPKCGGWIGVGYGLAGGGLGLYKFCLADGCNWFWKECERDES